MEGRVRGCENQGRRTEEIRKELDAGAGNREDQTQVLGSRCSREQGKQQGHRDCEDFPNLPSSCEVSMTSHPTAMRKRQDTHSAMQGHTAARSDNVRP